MKRLKQRHDWRTVDFSESNLNGCSHCKNCNWPVFVHVSRYPSCDAGTRTPFHVVGRWGEQTVCEDAVPTERPFGQALRRRKKS